MSYIDIKNLCISFKSYQRPADLKGWLTSCFARKQETEHEAFMAVNNVSLSIRSGERVGIVGHNGAGKSTLLAALCNVYPPHSGSIEVEGRIAPLLGMGAGFQPEFTGRENISLNASILGFDSRQIRNMEHEIIAFAELEEFIDTPVKYYSSGMYMRLAFSIATTINPDIIILDEVFASGDGSFLQKAMSRMEAFIDRANILIFVSHSLDLVLTMCNRVIWMDRGKVILDGESQTVLNKYGDYILSNLNKSHPAPPVV